MKRLLSLSLLFFSVDAMGMYHAMRSGQKIIPKNMQRGFNTPRNFGTTHFIVGYKSPYASSSATAEKKHIIVDEKLPIINGSSAHLIDENRHTQSFFTTVHNIPSIVSHVLGQAKHSISIAAFALTDPDITKQLIDAHEKGIKVTVIMDAGNMKHTYSKAQKLIDSGIAVWQYDPTLRHNYKKKQYMPYMHRKCYIIDEDSVITGSANLTKAGLNDNAEDINVLRCKQSVQEHQTEFGRLIGLCIKCTTKSSAKNKTVVHDKIE